jgi:16S rRNA (cytidine1402-2'-O)-methyltransferase
VGEPSGKGRLVLVGAPLGNPADASPRSRETLAAADLIAAEDTRRLARLARDLGLTLTGRVVSYFEGNEERRTPELVAAILDGALVALVTDAGMPSVSDPGFRLVRAAVVAGAPVTAAPGPSAVTTALALSGLPCDRFCFEGFLPRSAGARRKHLRDLAAEPRTLVFFEAPHRLAAALADLAEAFGADRPAAVCRELTKTYEEVVRRPLGELAGWAEVARPRGEMTVVVAGAAAVRPARPTDEQLRRLVQEREATGATRRDATAAVAHEYGLARREVYGIVHKTP